MDSFKETYKKGILSRNLFVESDIICEFIEWLVEFNDGKRTLQDLKFKHVSFNDCIKEYSWGEDQSFNHTLNRFREWNTLMKSANDIELLNICLMILKWGGVLSANGNKLKIRKNLKEYLLGIESLVSEDEIIIDDLNPNYINSGFTKIYTAFIKNFIMYDGRVGSALCYFISTFLKEKHIDALPTELIFGWGQGRSANYNRNPNDELNNYRFPEITQNRTIHFISNIKANWLLNSIDKKIKILDITDKNDVVFAFQTALFVLGENIPK